jgi:hypothetical protein
VVPAVHSDTALMRKARRLRTAWHNVTGLRVYTNKDLCGCTYLNDERLNTTVLYRINEIIARLDLDIDFRYDHSDTHSRINSPGLVNDRDDLETTSIATSIVPP